MSDRNDSLDDVHQERLDGLDNEFYGLDADPVESLDVHFDRYIEEHPGDFFVSGSEEDTASALVAVARGLIDAPFLRSDAPIRPLLEEAAARSDAGGDGTSARLARSLLDQLPHLGLK